MRSLWAGIWARAGRVMRWVVGIGLLLAASGGGAEERTVVIGYDPAVPGTYRLQIVIDGSGEATVRPLAVDYRLTTNEQPPPPPPPLSERAARYRELASSVSGDADRAGSALAVAGVYAATAAKIADGTIKDQAEALAVLKTASDLLLGQRGAVEAWQPVRERVSQDWAVLLQQGAPLPAYQDLCEDVAAGVRASAGAAPLEFNLEFLLRLISLIIELLRTLSAEQTLEALREVQW